MAIFANDNRQTSGHSGNTSIIAEGTKITGEIKSECNLHIDGDFEGNIIAKNSVVIGKNGSVNGSIDSFQLTVSGKVIGNCNCNTVEILPLGRIDGEVMAKELIIERNAEFIGKSLVHKDNIYKAAFSEKKLIEKTTTTPQNTTTTDIKNENKPK